MSEILLYKTDNDEIKLEVRIQNETIWLNQKQMASLFGVDSDTISYHLKNIYKTQELLKEATTEKISVVQQVDKLYAFLTLNDRKILQDNGKVSAKIAKKLPETEFEKYREQENSTYISDFDRMVASLEEKR